MGKGLQRPRSPRRTSDAGEQESEQELCAEDWVSYQVHPLELSAAVDEASDGKFARTLLLAIIGIRQTRTRLVSWRKTGVATLFMLQGTLKTSGKAVRNLRFQGLVFKQQHGDQTRFQGPHCSWAGIALSYNCLKALSGTPIRSKWSLSSLIGAFQLWSSVVISWRGTTNLV